MRQTNNTFVADFNNTYKAESNLNPMDYPASIIKLCNYILNNDRDSIDWKEVAKMVTRFENHYNTFIYNSFKNTNISIATIMCIMRKGFDETWDKAAYSTLIHRVETLKETCVEILIENAKEIATEDLVF